MIQQWYAFRAYNSETIHGFGTQAEADQYADRLNAGKDQNVYSAHGLGDSDEIDARLRDSGIQLEDELQHGVEQ